MILPLRQPVSIIMPEAVKKEVNDKISALQTDIKARLTELQSAL